jgi:hypothetical protein
MVRREALLRSSHPFPQQSSGQIFKDEVNSFSSTSGICFIMASNVEKRPTASSKYIYVIGTSFPLHQHQRPLALANSLSIDDIHPAENEKCITLALVAICACAISAGIFK